MVCRVAAFPIGIDPDRFEQALDQPDVRKHVEELRRRFSEKRVMLGVDRLDMIKGIPQKLLAFEKFLDEHPEWREKVVLLQIAVPTRVEVTEYQRLRSTVHEVVGRINGRYGTLTHVPIMHLDKNLSFTELVALYAVTDVCLVTSLRDGMNLVSFEYVACQRNKPGVFNCLTAPCRSLCRPKAICAAASSRRPHPVRICWCGPVARRRRNPGESLERQRYGCGD